MNNVQYIKDAQGKPEYVILSIADYEDLLLKAIPEDDEDEDEWEDIPVDYEEGDHEVLIPQDVVFLQFEHNTNLLGAWRIYRGLTQAEAAEKAGLTQSALSQAERKDSKPQKRTREKLAKVYDCTPEQLTL